MRSTRSAAAVLQENPYLRQVPETQQRVSATAEHKTVPPDVVDEKTAEEYRYEEGKKQQDGRRRILFFGGLAVILMASIFIATRYYPRKPRRVDYPDRQTTSRSALTTGNDSTTRPDSGNEKAVEDAQVMVGPTTPTANDASPSQTTPKSETVPGPDSNTQTGFNVPSNFGATVKAKAPETWATGPEGNDKTATTAPPPTQPRNSTTTRTNEASIYANDPRSATTETSIQRASTISSPPETIKVPPFGLMLPVRTLGGFYTLRNRALVRLELTRDMSGDGWSLKRGTVFVGTSDGAEVDRAHVSVIGFIDQQSGRFVKVGGDLRGNDGIAGIKGKRRQIDGGWTRMLAKIGTGALNLTSSFLAGRGSGTVILSDGLRARAVNPITEEINGIAGSELDQRGRSFVEVIAGTPGYVTVTDLPSNKDNQTAPAPEGQYLATATDVDAARPATGLSERELADLLSTGSVTEIRATLPRMSPEMRRLVNAFLDR